MSIVARGRTNVQDVYPLSPLQEGILFNTVYAPGSGVYVTQIVWTLRGAFDAGALREAWRRVADRHPALRTCCVWQDQPRPVQLVLRRVSVPWEELDWSGLSPAAQDEELRLLLEADRGKGFDLTVAPLIRLTSIRLGEGLHRLVWTFHHLVLDGWSSQFVLREILQILGALTRGGEAELPTVRPYRDYIAWLRRQDMKRAEAYWRETLAGFKAPTPLDLADLGAGPVRGKIQPDRHRRRELRLDAAAAAALRDLARRHRFTASALIHGAWALLLSHYSGRADVVFGTVLSGRPADLPGSGEMIGLFINTLPLRVEVVPRTPLPEWLRRLQVKLARLREVEYSPLIEVQGWSEVPRGLPLFESILTFESFEQLSDVTGAAGPVIPGLEIEISDGTDQTSLPLSITARPGSVDLEYDPRRFPPEAVDGVRDDFALLLRAVIERPEATLGELRERLARAGAERRAAAPEVEVPPVAIESAGEERPLSWAQRRLWWLDRLETDAVRAAYNLPLAWFLEGGLSVPVLSAAVTEITRRHTVLRTVFTGAGEEPMARVLPAAPVPLPVADLSALPEGRREAEAQRLAELEARRPFDLGNGPVLRLLLARLGETGHLLAGAVHRAVADAPSLERFAEELAALYPALLAGSSSPLRPLPLQFADFAAWQRRWLSGGELEERLAFWRRWLDDVPPALELPTDRPRPAARSLAGDVLPVRLPHATALGLERLAQEAGVPLLAVLAAGVSALLARYVRQDQAILATPLPGRLHPEAEPVIGPFAGPLPFKVDLREATGSPRFRDLLVQVAGSLATAGRHREVPFEAVVEAVAPEARLAHAPLFQVLVSLREALRKVGGPGFGLFPWPVETGTARLDLSIEWLESDTGLAGVLEYATELFERATILRLGSHLERLLAGAAAQPGLRLADLPLLSESERAQLLVEWNDSATVFPEDPSFQRLFAFQARRAPDAVAAVCDGHSLTYGELEGRAAGMARRLRRAGAGLEVVVALFAERSLEFLVGILGVLEAGAAYLPLEVSYPPERVRQILERSRARVALAAAAHAGALEPALAGLVEAPLVLALETAAAEPGGAPPLDFVPESLVYVIFTSGSTGQPKGAMLEHRGFLNHLLAIVHDLGLGDRDVIAQTASQCFDISVWQFLAALAVGGRVAVLPDPITHDPVRLLDALEAEEVSVVEPVPSLLRAMLDEVDRRGAERPGLAALRWVMPTGEALSPDLCRRWFALYRAVPLLNAYGPTECSDDVTFHAIRQEPPAEAPSVSIGSPIANLEMLVLDRDERPVPVGVAGELFVGGVGLGRGYLNDPVRTAEAFVPHPFAGEAGARLYRTGDLARWSTAGALDFLGRVDHQIKVRGFRIELGEVESALLAHPGVDQAVVVARGEGAERHLVGYVVTTRVPERGESGEPAPGIRELRDFLALRLPEYMVPTALVRLEAMPLTANGKVDRKALPAPTGEEAGLGEPVAPRTPVEGVLAGIWGEVLGLERVGVAHGFFELGGHSLLAMQVISRVRQAFRVELPLQALFEEPTVAGLARRVEQELRSAAGALAPPIVPVPRDGELPLSFAQQRLWFIDQLEPGSPLYNVPTALRVSGPLAVPVLARAFDELARRHETLRTVFASAEGRPFQVIQPPAPFPLPVADLSALPAAVRPSLAHRLAAEDALRPFDLARGPLLRAAVLRLGGEEHAVVMTMHHIVSDAWSMDLLIGEVARLYHALAAGRPSPRPPLPDLPVQYADFSAWQRQWLSGEVLEREMAYWRQRLAGMPPLLELSTDRPRPAVQTSRGALQGFAFGPDLSRGLERLARREGVTLFMLLLAGFQVLLGRYSGQRDISIGTPISGRNRLELEGLIGFFMNTLVLRGDLQSEAGGDLAFRGLLARVRETVLRDYLHQEVPFERLVEELAPARSLAYSPLFQVMLTLDNAPAGGMELQGLVLEPIAVEPGTAKFDLLLGLREVGGDVSGGLEYNTDLFDRTTALRLVTHFERLLAASVAAPDTRLFELPLLSAAESLQVLTEWNDTGVAPGTEACLHDLVTEQARRTPDAVAVIRGDERLSYGELDRRSARLAQRLAAAGLAPEDRVGIWLDRTPELVVALLGTLRAGGAYLPLDPRHPLERVALILDEARPRVVVSRRALAGPLASRGVEVLCLEETAAAPDAGVVEKGALPQRLAYVIYTSGSTGRPKGVAIQHRSAVALVRWAAEVFAAAELERVLASTSITFDLSVFELFVPLSRGAAVVLASDALELPSLPARDEVTLVNTVPSAMRELAEWGLPASVRTVSLAGEPLARTLVERIYEAGRVEAVWNLYGPSEDTTYSTFTRVVRGLEHGEPTIGRAVGGSAAYLLDRDLGPLPQGVTGDLYLSGAGLARGYLGRPDLTAERFVPDPFGALRGEPGARMYRTGDLARWLPSGELAFLGRADHQVKLRGFRIELGEIEAVLASHPRVGEAVAVVREDAAGDRRLVAYVVGREGAAPPAAELRAFLAERLPDYMVPSAVVELVALPLSSNGKVDRKALPAPERLQGTEAGGPAAPRTAVEGVLAGIFAEVLGLERVGIEASFFELGGHSLLATQVVARVRRGLQVELPLRRLFEAPTVAALAREVERELRAGQGLAVPSIVAVPRGGGLPLSFAQQRLWFLDQLEPGSAAYNIPLAVQLDGPLEPWALAAALREVVRRHEVLRTLFAAAEGEPLQHPQAPGGWDVPLVDLSALAEERRRAVARRLAAAEAARPFDLTRGPLLRGVLVRLDGQTHQALVTLHHIAGDGWSTAVLIQEVAALYGAFSEGRPSPLPELSVQYADFAVWQREWLVGEVLASHLSYWRQALAGAPALLELPTDRPRPAVQTLRGAEVPVRLAPELAAEIARLARRQGGTPFMVLLAGLQVALARHARQWDVSVGSPVAGRTHVEVEGLIGFFVNTLVLRSEMSGEMAFDELLGRVRETALAAQLHQEVPFERLVEELAPERSLAYSPLFQVMFALQNVPRRELTTAAGLRMSAVPAESVTAKFDLTLSLEEGEREVSGTLEYNTGLFDETTVLHLVDRFRRLLAAALADPETPLADLPLLSWGESLQVLHEWNDTGPARGPEVCLHELVVEQARRTPGAVAVIHGEERLSYGELERRSGRLARRLAAAGLEPEARVGIWLDRTLELVVALLGVLRAGGAYLPLDPRHPLERVALILGEAAPRVVLSRRALAAPLVSRGVEVLCLEEMAPDAGEEPRPALPQQLAYVIYTSGSTGRPKGVAIQHHSASALVSWAAEVFAARELERVLASTSITFDLSVFELFVPLSQGAAVVLAADALELPSLPARDEVTLVNTVPSAMRELAEWGLPASVRTVNLAGEPLARALVERIYASGRVEAVWNLYGPSEDTTYSTFTRVERGPEHGEPSIGRAIGGSAAYVLDAGLRPVPLGVTGELYLAGAGLARGYLGRPDLTAERFVPDPFGWLRGDSGVRLYRTGDLARWLPAGELGFLGRLDHQVKVRGFRIELGEIEAVLASHPRVAEAVVVARQDTPGDRRLVAYVVGQEGAAPAAAELRFFLGTRLPDYMVPGDFVELPALPLSSNGKVDRQALPAPEQEHGGTSSFVAPRTAVEGVLAGIFEEVLGRGQVGVEASFFTLGGHSLLATQVVARVRRSLRVELPLRKLFEAPTVAALAREVEAALRAGQGLTVPPVAPVPRETAEAGLPLSFAQQRLWFLDQLEPGSAAYNIPLAVQLDGLLAPWALAMALGEVARRHEVLRTVFEAVDGQPLQRPLAPRAWTLPLVDLSALPGERRLEEARALAVAEAAGPFDLARGPLLRTLLLRLDHESHQVLATLHHIAGDGWSATLLIGEVAALYAAFVEGRPSPLPALPVQYADFAVWQRSWLAGEVLESHLAYWRQALAGAPALLELPLDHPRPAAQTFRGAEVPVRLAPDLAAAAGALARRHEATPFMVLLAAFQAVLARHARTWDVSVGSPVAGRTHVEVEGLIGFFVNTLVLRSELSGDTAFGELLARVREVSLAAQLHQDVPFEKLVEELQPERSLAYSPLFQVMLVLQNVPRRELTASGLRMAALPVGSGTAKFDLTLTLEEADGELSGALEHNTDLFDGTTASRLADRFERLLAAALADPGAPLAELPLLSAPEWRQVIGEWNDTGVSEPGGGLVHERVLARAAEMPDTVAVVLDGEALTYGELRRRALHLAAHLGRRGAGRGDLVAIAAERSLEMVAGILGILAAGAAYVPLDPGYPRERLAFMLEDTRVAFVLTQERLAARLPRCSAETVLLDAPWDGTGPAPGEPARPGDLAYVIYTSGSTGRPKGVMITHRGLMGYLDWAARTYAVPGARGSLLHTSIAFDLTVTTLFVPLLTGQPVVLVPEAEGVEALASGLARESGLSFVKLTPSHARLLGEQATGGLLAGRSHGLIVGGEALYGTDLAAWREQAPATVVYNEYGPTEAVVGCALHAAPAGGIAAGAVAIGRPIQGARLYVLDEALAPVPPGVAGELYIGGSSLARGYLGLPALTADRFVPDPFGAGGRGARLYRTGDLARWNRDSELEYLGRLDHQVKVRGFRIELGEIETVLAAHPRVGEAVVVAREDLPGDRRLVAYVVGREGAAPAVIEMRSFLATRLPDYMVPSAFVELPALPLSPNGKVDRRALPAPERGQDEAGRYLAPRTVVEGVLAGIWEEVLGLERVGVATSFFELGGHSLLATQVLARVRRSLGVELPLRKLFEAPTVAALAQEAESALRAGRGLAVPPMVPVPRSGGLPLSFAQQRLWFLDQLEPGGTAYNVPLAVELDGVLDTAALAASLREVLRRHEVLRTVFLAVGGEPVQQPAGGEAWSLPLVDLSALPPESRQAEARSLAAAEVARPFDLERGPLFRACLMRLDETLHQILTTLHHIASDGWSMAILIEEVAALYGAFAAGQPSPLADLQVQYADFAVWQRRWLTGEVLEAHLSYWRERLAGAPALLELPTDRPRPPQQTFRGAQLPVRLAELGDLGRLGRLHGATPFMVLLAAFQTLLARHSGQQDVCVGTPVAGRTHVEVERLIGLFVNTLVLRGNLAGGLTFRDLLSQVRETALAAQLHQELPFEKLVEELRPERSLAHTPLFQVMFTLQNVPRRELRSSDLRLRPLRPEVATAAFDLTLVLDEGEGGWAGALEYNTDLFDRVTVTRWLDQYERLLVAALSAPEERLLALPLLSAAEHAQLLREWNDTGLPGPAGDCLHRLFELQVERTPDSVALVHGEEALTYRELDRQAGLLAGELRRSGAAPEVPVGVYLERGPRLLIALLGVLKAGAPYLALDPAQPRERLLFMLADAGADVVVTEARLRDNLPPEAGAVCLDRDGSRIAAGGRSVPARVQPGNPAYVMYTSGSTGRPKGVIVEHRSAAWYARAAAANYRVTAADRVLQFAPVSFDVSVEEIFPCLISGAALVLADTLALLSPARFLEACLDSQITCASPVTAFWHELSLEVAARPTSFPPALRLVVIGGEKPLAERAAAWRRHCGRCSELINSYGPTESTVVATLFRVTAEAVESPGEVPLGRPIPGARVHVLDGSFQLQPAGTAGELCIGGAGLARGYTGRPDLTAERFIPDPFSGFGGEPGGRLYRSGDLARHLRDGNLEYLGRVDQQVKIRGFRVEPREIEAALAACPGVQEVVVVAREETAGDRRLVAYFVATATAEPPTAMRLRELLRVALPDYMVPAAFVRLEALPLTPNGKVDRAALPAPERTAADAEVYVAPRTPVEEVLAGIWEEVLRLDRVGVETSFFALGGHSLLATQVFARLHSTFQVEVPLRRLFETPTVAALAAEVEAALRTGRGLTVPPLLPVPRGGRIPLSFAQQRLWFLDQLEPGAPLYNIPAALRLTGRLHLSALAWALTQVVERHEALRTVFAAVDGEPEQRPLPPAPQRLPVIDLSALPAGARAALAGELAAAEAGQPFDLAVGPLLRTALLRLGAEEHVFLLTVHHIVSDGWSMGILVREAATLYTVLVSGEPAPLPGQLTALPVQYADFAVWQRQWLAGEVLESEVDHWRQRLAGLPPLLDLPTDRPRPPVQSFRGAGTEMPLPGPVSRGITALSRGLGATPFMVVLAALQTLLARYSGQPDLAVGTPSAGRSRLETEGLIGFFVNTLVLRGDLAGDPAFRELVARVRDAALDAHAHQDVPFEKLVESLAPERSLAHSPLFQVLLVFQNLPRGGGSIELPGLAITPLAVPTVTAKFDLTLSVSEDGGELLAALDYNTDLFDGTTAARLLRHLEHLLEAAAATPDAPLSALSSLRPAERGQLLTEWNDTAAAWPADACLHDLVAAAARRWPQAVAITSPEGSLTYAQLDLGATRLAGHLRRLGVGPEVPVALFADRTPDMVLGMLGVLKAGGAYLPLDPAYPADRVALMLKDAAAPVVLAQSHLEERLPPGHPRVVYLDSGWQTFSGHAVLPDRTAVPESLAYLIYTSGSTGHPKAVAIQHRNAVAFLAWAAAVFPPEDLRGVLASTSICFDLSVFELFLPLVSGGTVVLAQNALHLHRLADAFEITLVNTVPSAIRELIGLGRLPASVRTVNLAGEPLDRALAERIHEAGSVRLFNLYGPSEDTTYSTFTRVDAGGAGEPAIGRPIANTTAHVLDAGLQPAAIGIPGELYLGGAGLARGYRGRPELTAERFVPDPFGGLAGGGARLYRTGDLVRRRPDGDLEFLGRRDHQVKVRGFRIELGEVEAALASCPGVADAAALALGEGADRRLVAFVVPHPAGGAPEVADGAGLRPLLEQRLPGYMVPSSFVSLTALPRTPNGKLDRAALVRLAAADGPRGAAPGGRREALVAPRDLLELRLSLVWEEVLGIQPIGVKDDFFELGGHSLLAVRLVARIDRELGISLPLVAFFQAPTIELLACLLRNEGMVAEAASPLVPLQPRGSRRPLFLAHPATGEIFGYLELARRLDPDQPFYALRSPSLLQDGDAGREGAPGARIEEMAAEYLRLIREVQPRGPYRLGGWSMGGAIAFEMVRQLRAAGEEVELLVLLDAAAPGALWRRRIDDLERTVSFVEDFGYSLEDFHLTMDELVGLDAERQRDRVLANARGLELVPPDFGTQAMERLYRVFTENFRAMKTYFPRRTPVRVVLFRAAERPGGRVISRSRLVDSMMSPIRRWMGLSARDPLLGWGGLVGAGIEVHEVPGSHATLVREPNVQALAEILEQALQSLGKEAS